MSVLELAARVLPAWEGLGGGTVEPAGSGLINDTFLVSAERSRPEGRRFVLQRLSTIFDPAIHENIEAVTRALDAAGITTPLLVPTRTGELFARDDEGRCWRVQTFVHGVAFDALQEAEQARSAAALVARFHGALERLDHAFVGRRLGVHDTPRHLSVLAGALEERRDHRLTARVAPLGERILAAAEALPALPSLPELPCHGDLKISNVLFEPDSPQRALCLIDLDTLAPMQLAHEMGDALRSWCSPHAEDSGRADVDLDVFGAAVSGYRSQRELSRDEREALLLGLDWISLELAARFAADALRESYFGWDPTRFPGAGEHQLVRAETQWALHERAVATRSRRARLLRA